MLYIDGAHRVGPARDDIVRWGAKVAPGGTLLIHDSYSSVGVTLALLTTLVPGRSVPLPRAGRLAGPLPPAGSATAGAGWPTPGGSCVELGWFARNVVVKALLVARLGRVARLLGHDGETWPY